MSIQAAFFGRLTRDPEYRQINGNYGQSTVASFTVAVDAGHKDKSGQNRQYLECRADHVEFVPRDNGQQSQQQWQQPQQGYQPSNQMPFNNAPQGAPQNGPQNGFYQQQGNQPQQRPNTPQQQNMGQMNNFNAAMPTNGQQPNNNQQSNSGQQAFGPASNGYRQ